MHWLLWRHLLRIRHLLLWRRSEVCLGDSWPHCWPRVTSCVLAVRDVGSWHSEVAGARSKLTSELDSLVWLLMSSELVLLRRVWWPASPLILIVSTSLVLLVSSTCDLVHGGLWISAVLRSYVLDRWYELAVGRLLAGQLVETGLAWLKGLSFCIQSQFGFVLGFVVICHLLVIS